MSLQPPADALNNTQVADGTVTTTPLGGHVRFVPLVRPTALGVAGASEGGVDWDARYR